MLRYVIQCRDVVSGKTGDFVTDSEKVPFRAISPVFSDLMSFFEWLHASEYEQDGKEWNTLCRKESASGTH